MEALLRELKLDLSRGLEILTGAQLATRLPAGDLPLVVGQVDRNRVDVVTRALMARYPADHPVAAWCDGALKTARLYELERLDWAEYQTSLYLEPLQPSQAGETDPRRWVAPRWPADPLVAVMAKLRAPEGGCPWDREQTHQSLRKYMLEEAYEAVEAIDTGDPRLICEELGDVLLQVVFNAQVASEAGQFTFHDVVEGIAAKLVRRHPHVFGDVVAETPEAVTQNWEAIKRAEKGGPAPESALGKLSQALPALSKAYAVQKRAAKVGFDWDDIAGPVAKVREELEEVLAASGPEQEGEVGDLLFAVVNLARMLKIDPEVALAGTVSKFARRFRHIERRTAEMGLKLEEMPLAELDKLWDEAKRAEFRQKSGEKYPNP